MTTQRRNEGETVAPDVAGSNPVGHPKTSQRSARQKPLPQGMALDDVTVSRVTRSGVWYGAPVRVR